MNLEEFIEISLKQIISGVKKAQQATRLPGKDLSEADVVNPAIMYSADSAPKGKYFATIGRNLVHLVDFDVAVTTDSSSEAKAGLNLKVAGIGFGGGGGVKDRDSVVSRIKFQIPITLPQSTDKDS
jgi:phosphoribosylformimino-5-aminoimidazole carboxamide ribonucleotide (ProFAR) isomerase